MEVAVFMLSMHFLLLMLMLNQDFEAFTPKLKEWRNFGVTFLHWIFCNGRSIASEKFFLSSQKLFLTEKCYCSPGPKNGIVVATAPSYHLNHNWHHMGTSSPHSCKMQEIWKCPFPLQYPISPMCLQNWLSGLGWTFFQYIGKDLEKGERMSTHKHSYLYIPFKLCDVSLSLSFSVSLLQCFFLNLALFKLPRARHLISLFLVVLFCLWKWPRFRFPRTLQILTSRRQN